MTIHMAFAIVAVTLSALLVIVLCVFSGRISDQEERIERRREDGDI